MRSSLKKTGVLLRSLCKLARQNTSSLQDITYYAVDLEHEQLVSTLDTLLEVESGSVTAQPDAPKVLVKGVRASYDEVRPYLAPTASLFDAQSCKSVLWLGSSLGNFTRPEAAQFLKAFVDGGLSPGDSFLIGIDCNDDAEAIELAYGDPAGVTTAFTLNGLDHATRILRQAGYTKADISASKFEHVHRYNSAQGCHEVCQMTTSKIDLILYLDRPISKQKTILR